MNLLFRVVLTGMGAFGADVWQRSCLAEQVPSGAMTATNLRCEYAANPIGIDISQPRFSWTLESTRRGQVQSAYQILVASNRSNLQSNLGDKWDSGKVISDKSVNVPYSGGGLSSAETCWWKVRAWDKNGTASPWSEPAMFEMGLLKESDWQCEWIGMGPDTSPNYIPGHFGQAVNLDGKRQSIMIPMYPALHPLEQLTISAWIKPGDHSSDGRQYIYRKDDSRGNDDATHYLAIERTGKDCGLWFGIGIKGPVTEDRAWVPAQSIIDHRWHLLVATYDGSSKRVFLDGVEIANWAVGGPMSRGIHRSAYIGSHGGGSGFFNGGIDDVRIYKRALSLCEIKAMWDGVPVESELVGGWKLDHSHPTGFGEKKGWKLDENLPHGRS